MLFSEHNFDLVHARYVFSDGLLAYMLSKKFNIPYFINTHNEKVYFEHSGSRRRAVRILNNAAFVLPLNHSNYLYFKTLSIKNMERTTHGFNKDFVRKQKPESKKKISILTVSVLIKLKNIDKVIHAISKLMPAYDLTYTIIGKGSEKEHLVNLVESLNLTDHVSFIDQIPHSEISDEMYKHDIFIMPSYFETFGRVYFEAMAMGIPIICAKNSGIFGLFKDKEEGIAVNHLDINEISDALEFLITNPTDRLRIGENGQKLVVNYTWENIAKDLHTKYLNSLTK